MKFIITIIIALGAAIGLSLIAMEDPGYVVLARDPYTVRLPLALFVLIILALFAILYLLFNFVVGIFRAPKKVRKWHERSNEASAQKNTMQGYAGLIEGNWSKAEKKLLSHLQHNKSPLLNYLGAAYAAQQQGHMARRDRYLDDALEQHPGQQLAIDLTRARLHFQAGEVAESRDALESLRKIAPKNVAVARLLADVYHELEDWNSLTSLMPTLTRLKAFPADQLADREKQVYEHYLSSPALLQGDSDRPMATFKSLPATKRKDANVIASYAKQLIRAGDPVLAEKTLRKALNRRWDAELAYLYGKVETSFSDDQIKLAESWAKKYGDHPDLTLTLGRLYRRDRQLEKARDLFSQVIANDGREEACADLGTLLEEMGEKDAALLCYREGMAALVPDLDFADPAPVSTGELLALDVEQVDDAETDVEAESEADEVSTEDTEAKAEKGTPGVAEVMPVVR